MSHDQDRAVAGGLPLAGDEDHGRVTWLAVRPDSRRQGIRESLVREALHRLRNSSTVSVVSFGPDMVEGRTARLFYEHLGFRGREMVADGPGRQVPATLRTPQRQPRPRLTDLPRRCLGAG